MALTFAAKGRLFIVLDEENMERVQNYDPFELDTSKFNSSSLTLYVPLKISICFAKKDEYDTLKQLKEQGNISKVVDYLYRGFKVTETDHDRNYDILL